MIQDWFETGTRAITIHEYKMPIRKKRGGWAPLGCRLIVWGDRWAEWAPPPKGKKGGGLLGNGPPSLETGELYNFTRLYCFLTTNDF